MSLSSGSPGSILLMHAVQAGHHHGGESEIRIRGRIRRAELHALGLGTRRVHRNPASRGTVAPRIRQVHRSFVARHQPLVAIGGGCDDRRERAGVLQQTADIVQRHRAQAGISIAGEQRLAALPDALVCMHAAAVIRKQRLGHEGHRLAGQLRHVADNIFVQHHVVGGFHQRVEALIDFALSAGGHFVMVALDIQAAPDHGLHHGAAQVLVMIGGRHREITFLVARAISQVVAFAARVPAAFLGVDEVEAGVLILIEAHVVEDEELRFRAEVRSVADARVLQVQLRFARDPARVAIVVLPRDGIEHVAHHHERRDFIERIDECRGWIRNQQHVAFIDGRPATDAGAVHSVAILERILAQFRDGIRDVMLQTGNI